MDIKVICLEEPAFFSLIDTVYAYLKEKHNLKYDKWISGEEAMKILRITSKTTLQKLRDTGKIRFSNIGSKHIIYDIDSINEYLEKNANNTF